MRNNEPPNLYRNCEDFLTTLYNNYPKIFRAINDLIIKYNQNPSKTKKIFASINDLIKNNDFLTKELNKLLNDDLKIVTKEESQPPNEEKALQIFQKKLTECFNLINLRNPGKINMIIEHFEEATKNSDSQDPIYLAEEALKNFKIILFDEHDLFQEINNLLTVFLKQQKSIKEKKETNNHITHNNNKSYKKIVLTPIKKKEDYDFKFPSAAVNKIAEELDFLDLSNTKSEMAYLEKKAKEMSPSNSKAFYKLLYLYTESIISISELFAFVEKLIPNADDFIIFKKIISSRDVSRKKTALFFKPSCETDTTKFERVTHSYIKLPDKLHNFSSESWKENSLNKTWVSIPIGSEHYTFCNMRKNQFEEALFKCEDEKFDLDTVIVTYINGINFLKKIMNNEERTKHWDKLKKFKSIQKSFNSYFEEINNAIITKNEELIRNISNDLLDKMNLKLLELQNVKNNSKKNWKEISEKNFFKSLDHKLFYFKRQEKSLTINSKFLKDVEDRFAIISKKSSETENLKLEFLKPFNTFEKITMDKECTHIHDYKVPGNINVHDFEIWPIFSFNINNQKVLRESILLLWFTLQNSHLTNNEKDKTKKYLKRIFNNFFDIPLKNIEIEEIKAIEDEKIDNWIAEVDMMAEYKSIDIEKEDIPSFFKMQFDSEKKNHKTEHSNENFSKRINFPNDAKIRLFFPEMTSSSEILYGTKNLYIFLRFFYTFYERMLMIYQTKEVNLKNLDPELRIKVGLRKYEIFKVLLILLIKQKIDAQKFEDYMKALFCQESFLTVTIEKVLNLTVKSCSTMINDLFNTDIFEFSKNKIKDIRNSKSFEISTLYEIDKMAREKKNFNVEKNAFRFIYDKENSIILINYFELPSKYWENEKYEILEGEIQNILLNPTNKHKITSGLPVYLKRNKKKSFTKNQYKKGNLAELDFCSNSFKLKTANNGESDFFFFKEKTSLNHRLTTEFAKVLKTKFWLKKTNPAFSANEEIEESFV